LQCGDEHSLDPILWLGCEHEIRIEQAVEVQRLAEAARRQLVQV
jgi:hypothetical protein